MSRRLNLAVECVLDVKNTVGESPVWSIREQALYWVDIPAGRIQRWVSQNDQLTVREFGQAIGSIGLREHGGLVLAMKSGFAILDDFANGEPRILVNPEPGRPTNRLNDGKVAPDGRFWSGTMDDRPVKEPVGHLYRLDPDYQCTRMVSNVIVSNGLAWSPDGHTLYHSDSRGAVIWRYHYDAVSGVLGERQVFVSMQPEWGRPDGAAVDVEGCYWSCGIGAGRLNRFSPSGELIEHVELPVSHPTMPCFGGPDLSTLYFTSLREGLSDEQLAQSPQAGGVFTIRPGVAGTPIALFRG